MHRVVVRGSSPSSRRLRHTRDAESGQDIRARLSPTLVNHSKSARLLVASDARSIHGSPGSSSSRSPHQRVRSARTSFP